MRHKHTKHVWITLISFLSLALLTACTVAGPEINEPQPGQTEFTTEDPNGGSNNYGPTSDDGARAGGQGTTEAAPSANSDTSSKAPGAPSGRTGTVEEADLYRVSGNLLFYLNTYKGLTVFDVSDRKKPKKISGLPVYGYPIEMFIEKNMVYALVRDALYLSKVNGKFEFQRRHTSQLVSIDISRPSQPRVLQRLDIKGQLREGVSRKIDNTVYVVSYVSRYYWWGWNYNRKQQEEQATVYSFNVANPRSIQKVQSIDLIKDRPQNTQNNPTTTGNSREYYSFSGITISATSNTLLVGENWYHYKYTNNTGSCSSSENSSYTKLSVIDISDPKGTIRVHTRFKVRGRLTDQFKHTYIFDEKTKKGTYLGIFQRNEWNRENCDSQRVVKNTLLSVDITRGDNPVVLDELVFGKPNETVRGSLFDPDRKVVYAITAVQRDPFYAISFADLSNLKIKSEIDGLSGDINLFRFLKNRQFLLAVGRDNSNECTGFDNDASGWRSTKLAVSLIDVRDLSKSRLVQRKCVLVKNASWTSSQINWNLDQAHKMIGLHHEGDTTLLTVPVDYYSKSDSSNGWWWWYERKSAIGIMKWDLTKYDDTKSEKEQNVMENIATVIHPKGSVKRTVITKINNQRTVINMSTTHLSLVDLQDLSKPSLLSTYDIAPYVGTVYRFGNYIVEQSNLGRSYQDYNEFRVKKLGSGDLNDAPIVKTIKMGRIRNVIRWKNYLVIFSYPYDKTKSDKYKRPYFDYSKSVVRVYDFTNAANPVPRGSITLPIAFYPYYYFYCGTFDMAYRFGYYGYRNNSWVSTDRGLALLNNRNGVQRLSFLDLSNGNKPAFNEVTLPDPRKYNNNQITGRGYYNLVSLDGSQFYLTFNTFHKQVKRQDRTYYQYRYYAQPWTFANGKWSNGKEINIPGHLIRVFRQNNKVNFLTQDSYYVQHQVPQGNGSSYTRYQQIFRLYLLQEYGKGLAVLRDFHSFVSWSLRDLLVDNGRIYLNAQRDWYWMQNNGQDWSDQSDHLMIFDVSKGKLDKKFSKATRTQGVQFVGLKGTKLLLNLPSEGLLVADVASIDAPQALHFQRTLGWSTNIEFSGDLALVAAGHFGIYQLDLNKVTIPVEQ
tara:strand:+ start:6878 stop:10204 length:3327 start_codon:yes stop_codon:yes gene_type:complete